jgi:hypothetical protein
MQVAPEAPARPEQALPEAPPAQPERKSRRARWIVAAIIAGAIAVAAANTGSTQTAAPAAPKIDAPASAVPDTTANMVTWAGANAPKMQKMGTAFTRYDLTGAIAIADSIETPIPDARADALWGEFLGHIHTAGTMWNTGDIAGATAELKQATTVMNRMSEYITTEYNA